MTFLFFFRNHGVSTPAAPAVPGSPSDLTIPTLRPQLRLSSVLCRRTGEQVGELTDLRARRILIQLNLPVQVIATLNTESDLYAEAQLDVQPRMKIYRQSTPDELILDPTQVRQLVFYGSLPSEGVDEDANAKTAILVFQEPSWVLSRRAVQTTVTYTQIDQGMILWGEIDRQNLRTNGDTWIRQGVIPLTKLRDRTYDPGKEVAGLIDDMTKVDEGCDVAVLPVDYYNEVDGSRAMGTFNTWAERGTDRSEVKFIYSKKLGSNVGNMRRRRGPTITSATSQGISDTQTYQNTTSAFGLLEDFETFTDVSESQTLLDKSVGKVANAQNAPMIVEVEGIMPNAPQPLIDYNVGDIVYLTCDSGGMRFLDLGVRVHAIDIDIDQNGNVSTKLTIASLPATDLGQIYVPPVGGGTGGSSGSPPGNERIVPFSFFGVGNGPGAGPYEGHGGNEWVVFTKGGGTTLSDGANQTGLRTNAVELIVGHSYTVRAQTCGDSDAPGAGPFKFYLFAADSGWAAGIIRGTNQGSRIFSATSGIRTTFAESSVTFVATATSMIVGWQSQGSPDEYAITSNSWTIEPA